MSYVLDKSFVMTQQHGDTGYQVVTMNDAGIHVQFGSQANMETFAGALGGLLEGKVTSINSSAGVWYNPDTTKTNDNGTAVNKTFSVKFEGVPMSQRVTIYFCKALKIKEIAQLLKTQDFYLGATKLVVKSISASV